MQEEKPKLKNGNSSKPYLIWTVLDKNISGIYRHSNAVKALAQLYPAYSLFQAGDCNSKTDTIRAGLLKKSIL